VQKKGCVLRKKEKVVKPVEKKNRRGHFECGNKMSSTLWVPVPKGGGKPAWRSRERGEKKKKCWMNLINRKSGKRVFLDEVGTGGGGRGGNEPQKG